MPPKEPSEQEVYAAIVAEEKAKAAKKPAGQVTGDQVSHAIEKRWAHHQGRPFALAQPEGPIGVGSTAVSPPADRPVSPIPPAAAGAKPKTPKEERNNKD